MSKGQPPKLLLEKKDAQVSPEEMERMDDMDCRPLKSREELEAMGLQVPEHMKRAMAERQARTKGSARGSDLPKAAK